MSILPYQTIKRLGVQGMIFPFRERGVAYGRTYGVGPASYDLCLNHDLWIWPAFGRIGRTIEELKIPPDVAAFVMSKSTNARLFINASQGTYVDPGFGGVLMVEITRHLPWPVRLRKGTPIIQLVFMRLEEPTERPYVGKYSNQPHRIVGPIMEGVPPVTHRVMMWNSRQILRFANWLKQFGRET